MWLLCIHTWTCICIYYIYKNESKSFLLVPRYIHNKYCIIVIPWQVSSDRANKQNFNMISQLNTWAGLGCVSPHMWDLCPNRSSRIIQGCPWFRLEKLKKNKKNEKIPSPSKWKYLNIYMYVYVLLTYYVESERLADFWLRWDLALVDPRVPGLCRGNPKGPFVGSVCVKGWKSSIGAVRQATHC